MPQTQAQSEVDQIGVDTRTHNGVASGDRRHRWPDAAHRLAVRLATEHGLGTAETVRRLEAEHGLSVPPTTVAAWLRSAPIVSADPASLRERIYRLAARELASLERQGRGKADLRRLEALSRILRTAETDRPNSQQARGLERFAQMAETDSSDHEHGEAFDVEASPRASR